MGFESGRNRVYDGQSHFVLTVYHQLTVHTSQSGPRIVSGLYIRYRNTTEKQSQKKVVGRKSDQIFASSLSKLIETLLTQCRSLVGVLKPSPLNT